MSILPISEALWTEVIFLFSLPPGFYFFILT